MRIGNEATHRGSSSCCSTGGTSRGLFFSILWLSAVFIAVCNIQVLLLPEWWSPQLRPYPPEEPEDATSSSLQHGIPRNEEETASYEYPYIAWLMSYPHSGTSYTLWITRQISNFTTASNYGQEHVHDGNSILIDPHKWPHGPFWANKDQRIPPRYILTKTHCGGRCLECHVYKFLETPRSFERECLRSLQVINNETRNKNLFYSNKIVKRAVHLIRHPMDNIVSRFHWDNNNNGYMGGNHTNDVQGFQEWCAALDDFYENEYENLSIMSQRWLDPDLYKLFQGVPCYMEFYRYIQWHNLAIITQRSLRLQMHIMYYEDYEHKWKESAQRLLHFLQLPPPYLWKEADPFQLKTYHDSYFNSTQKKRIHILLRELAHAETWDLLRRYHL